MASLFSRIIDRQIPARIVYEDQLCLAFLDISPLTAGHTLVVPKEEIDQWTDLNEELAAHLMGVARKIGRAQVRAFSSARAGLVIAGYEIPHAHLHVFPSNSMKDFDFSAAKPASDEELEASFKKLRQALESEDS